MNKVLDVMVEILGQPDKSAVHAGIHFYCSQTQGMVMLIKHFIVTTGGRDQ